MRKASTSDTTRFFLQFTDVFNQLLEAAGTFILQRCVALLSHKAVSQVLLLTALPFHLSTDDQFNGLQALSHRRDTVLAATTTAPPVPYQQETELVSLHSYDPDEDYVSPNLYNPHLGPTYHHNEDHDDHDELEVSVAANNTATPDIVRITSAEKTLIKLITFKSKEVILN